MAMIQRRPETERLIEFLANAPHGYELTYRELSERCLWNPKEKHLLHSAISFLADDGMQFKAIPGVGYVKLKPDSGVKEIRQHHNTQQVRSTSRMERKLKGVRISSLTPEGKQAFHKGIQEVYLRREAEQQFERDALREAIADKREKQLKEREKKERSQTQKFLEWAQQNNVG